MEKLRPRLTLSVCIQKRRQAEDPPSDVRIHDNTGKRRDQLGYEAGMRRQEGVKGDRASFRVTERGNIVLISALLVLALGATTVGLGRLVSARMDYSTDVRLSNYPATLATEVAESAINGFLYAWKVDSIAPVVQTYVWGTTPPFNASPYNNNAPFVPVTTTYHGLSGDYTVTSNTNTTACTIAVTDGGSYYQLVVRGTVSPANPSILSLPFRQPVTRQVTVQIIKATYNISSYSSP